MRLSVWNEIAKMGRGWILLLALSIGLGSCGKQSQPDDSPQPKSSGEQQMSKQTIQEVLKAHTRELMKLPGVVGTAPSRRLGPPPLRPGGVRPPV